MASGVERNKNYELLADELFMYCLQALDTIKFRVTDSSPGLGLVKSKKPTNYHTIEIKISPVSDQESKLYINAYKGTAFGGRGPIQPSGVLNKDLDKFFETLDAMVRRAKIQYG